MQTAGSRILITAGPTIEPWDDVRYLTNRSSGRTGLEIARRAHKAGAGVTLISSVKEHGEFDFRHILISSAREMFKEVKKEFKRCTIFISSAAVADFRPVYKKGKIEKRKGTPVIELKRNPDILKWAGENKGDRLIVGFSLQEKFDMKKAKLKQEEKNCDIMIVNTVGNLGSRRKKFSVIKDGPAQRYKDLTACEMAEVIIELCLKTEKNY